MEVNKTINFDFDKSSGLIIVEIDEEVYEGSLVKAKSTKVKPVELIGQKAVAAYLNLLKEGESQPGKTCAPYISEWERNHHIKSSDPLATKKKPYLVSEIEAFASSVKGKELIRQIKDRNLKST